MKRRKTSAFPRGSGPEGCASENFLASLRPLTSAFFDDAAVAGAKLAHQQECLAQVLHVDRLTCPLMAGEKDQRDAVLHEWLDVQALAQTGVFDERKLNAMLGDRVLHLVGVAAEAVTATRGCSRRKAATKLGVGYKCARPPCPRFV